MPATELGTLLRAVGEAPTEAKLDELTKMLGKGEGGTLTFEELIRAVKDVRETCPRPTKEELEAAFLTLDKSKTGYIAVSELRETLTTLGEPLDADELERVLGEIDVREDGKVDCSNLAKLLAS